MYLASARNKNESEATSRRILRMIATFTEYPMGIICSDTGRPYVRPEVSELELQEMIEHAENEVFWANYHLQVARNVAQQIRERDAQ